jgi:hypothetical protein
MLGLELFPTIININDSLMFDFENFIDFYQEEISSLLVNKK